MIIELCIVAIVETLAEVAVEAIEVVADEIIETLLG